MYRFVVVPVFETIFDDIQNCVLYSIIVVNVSVCNEAFETVANPKYLGATVMNNIKFSLCEVSKNSGAMIQCCGPCLCVLDL
jgi:hypothetical protein